MNLDRILSRIGQCVSQCNLITFPRVGFHGTQQDAKEEVKSLGLTSQVVKEGLKYTFTRAYRNFLYYVAGLPPPILLTWKVLNTWGDSLTRESLSKPTGSK